MIKTVCDFCGKTLKSEKNNQNVSTVWSGNDAGTVSTLTMYPTYEGLDMCEQCYKDAKKRKLK